MSDAKNSYRQVLKATSLFGGVQVINILVTIVRSKVIALLIGPTGMGIASLLNSTLGLVNGVTNLGLDRSAVKDISLANNPEQDKEVTRVIGVLRTLVWFTITFGMLVMVLASPLLSEFAFGSKAYTISFIWISVALLFKQLSSSQLAILQGLRKLNSLAKANVYGSILGLIITIPLYYFYRIDAIVPAIIITAFISFVFTFYYTKKASISRVQLSSSEVISEGKQMVNLGIVLSLSGMIGLLVAYLIQVYISAQGGVFEVGLYNAGIVILNSYVGIIFNAMGTDYFPRLSAIADKIEDVKKMVFEQAHVALLLITPIIVLFLTFAQFIIVLLYSEEFTPIVKMVSWGIMGMVFKAVSFSMGYVIIAKGDSKVFIKTAIGFNSILLVSNVIGYYLGGLEGIGISFFLYYIIHFLGIKIITYYRYNFYFEKGFYKLFTSCIVLCVTAFLLTFVTNPIWKYVAMSGAVILSFVFSYIQLNKKMNIKEFVKTLFNKKK